MSVFVFGHRNPDADAICSAIAYADYLQRTSRPNAIAACCGTPNKRTEFALKTAGVSMPKIIMDVRPEVIDVCQRNTITAQQNEVFYEIYERMKRHQLSSIPIVDDKQRLLGLLSLLDLLQLIFDAESGAISSRSIDSSLGKICQVLGGTYQHATDVDAIQPMLVMVGAMSAEGFTQRIHQLPADRLVVVAGDRPTIQLPALEHQVKAIVVTGGYELSSGLLQLAKSNGVTIIKSPFDTATTTMRIKSSRIIQPAIDTQCLTLGARLPLADAAERVERSTQKLFPVVDDQRKLLGVLSKSDLLNPPKPQLILVDHNELSQAVVGADEADILEVLDHHRIGGGLKTSQPIKFINDPVGSTCTLVARQFRGAGLEPTAGIALCMASGIISDTLFLRSPTTTDSDRNCLEWLRSFIAVDLEQYAKEFFSVGSALRDSSPADVIREDCKEFEEQGRRFSISQIEETGFDLFWQRRSELLEALQQMAIKNRLEFAALMITDIVSNGSLLLMSREPSHWEEINYPQVDEHLYELKDVVSRKKQLLPLICRLLESEREGNHS